ncbi:unnamed protein product [Orchesella dallaii]|uniref:Uncharacterized protein n=1 Tax=Orchesella dallaii TaxID=48710 RepID=A0ABP1QGI4_9HEXA
MNQLKNLNVSPTQTPKGKPGPNEVLSSTEVLEQNASITWKIEGSSDDSKWEAIKTQGKCFLEIGNKSLGQSEKLCFFLRDDTDADGDSSVALHCNTVNKCENDIPLRFTITKINSDGTSDSILNSSMKILKRDSGPLGTAIASCCLLDGRETKYTRLFPDRSQSKQTENQGLAVAGKDFIRIVISVTMYSCRNA